MSSRILSTAIAFTGLISSLSADVIVQYGTAGSTTSLAPAVVSSSVSATDLVAGTGIAVQTFSTFNFSGWDPANVSFDDAVAADEQWTWGFTVEAGSLNVTTLDIRLDRSGSGPDDFEIQAVVTPSGGSPAAPVSVLTHDFDGGTDGVNFVGVDISALGTLSAGDSVEFTLAAFNATSTGGTFDLETITFPGGNDGIVINGNIAGVTPDLQVELGQTVLFEDAPSGLGLYTGTVSRTGDTTNEVTVTIVSSDETAATADATVVIPADESSAPFSYDPAGDISGSAKVVFDFTAAGYNPASATVLVIDDEAVTPDVVINELLYHNTEAADPEFVELFNNSGGPVDIQGWTFVAYGADSEGFPFGGVSDSVSIPSGAPVLVPDQMYLIGNSEFETVYGIVPDTTASLSIDNQSVSFALFDADGNLVFSALGTDGDGIANLGGSEFVDGDFNPFVPEVEFGPDQSFTPAGFRFAADGGGYLEILEFAPQPSPSATPGLSNVLTPSLTFAIDVSFVPEDGGSMAAVGTIGRRYLDPGSPLTVMLSDDDGDDSEISIPESVTFLAGETTATFDIGVLTDGVQDGLQTITISVVDEGAVYAGASAQIGVSDIDAPQFTELVINELDADQEGDDIAEFVELYNLTDSAQSMDGLVLVFFNGGSADDPAYLAIDLTGYSIPASGFFVIGHAATVAGVDLDFDADLGLGADNVIQNGADAVALFVGTAANFPNGTTAVDAVAGFTLLDALVYDTSDADDTELLAALSVAEQINENQNGDGGLESVARSGDGAASYVAGTPTPGSSNGAVASVGPEITDITLLSPTTVQISFRGNAAQTYVLTSDPDLQAGFGTVVTPTGGSLTTDGSGNGTVEFDFVPGALYFRIEE